MTLSALLDQTLAVVYGLDSSPWIGAVHCDASLSEVHSWSGEATEHPVEEGSNISDHYRVNPLTVRIEGFITNTPTRVPLSQAQGVQDVKKEFTWKESVGIGGVIGLGINAIASATGLNKDSATAMGFEPEFDRVTDAFDELTRIVEKGQVIDISTVLKFYPSMVIESLEFTDINANRIDGKAQMNSIRFTAVAKQIRTVFTDFDPSPEPITDVKRAKPTKNKGKQATKTLEDGSPAKQKSLGKKIVTAIVGG